MKEFQFNHSGVACVGGNDKASNTDASYTIRAELEGWQKLFRKKRAECEVFGTLSPALEEFRWTLEEYRVSLFAQELSGQYRVSSREMLAKWNALQEQ